jgi:hypothetical protein
MPGVGAGLRFDFSFLVLRTDLAPNTETVFAGRRPLVLDQVRLGASSWRKENLVLTSPLAIHFNSVVLYLYLFVYSYLLLEITTIVYLINQVYCTVFIVYKTSTIYQQ